MTAECSEGSCAVHACATNLPTYWKIYSGVVLRMNPATFSLAWLTRLKILSDTCAKFSTIMSILWMRISKASPHLGKQIPSRQEREGNLKKKKKKGPGEFVFLQPLGLRGTFNKDRHLSTYLSLSVIRLSFKTSLILQSWLPNKNKIHTHSVRFPKESGGRERCFKIVFAEITT